MVYENLSYLGSGCASRVYSAIDAYGHKVALKTVGYSGWLRDRVDTLTRINHPNLCRILGLTFLEGQCFLVLEELSGSVLTSRASSSDKETKSVLLDLCSGAHALHSNGLLHRDIYVSNIFRARDGSCKLIDLDTPKYKYGNTPPYCEGTPRDDIYQIGIVAHILCTGVHPYPGVFEALQRTEENPSPVVPGPFKNFIRSALQYKPENRPATAIELKELLPYQ